MSQEQLPIEAPSGPVVLRVEQVGEGEYRATVVPPPAPREPWPTRDAMQRLVGISELGGKNSLAVMLYLALGLMRDTEDRWSGTMDDLLRAIGRKAKTYPREETLRHLVELLVQAGLIAVSRNGDPDRMVITWIPLEGQP